ncbi:DNA polymerase eta subunit [Kwoniella mangroviensis CBS 10435]|uniref:DNA polymerase eta n=1 Tax=Kwoniella mangroviensis CBS 10435 TaxID=1331196 RepID=A0A1B9IPH0_9TREE|nr:DNA polymerase eta subunit [Kwoniella mangroviensis CBS 10435]
MSFLSGPSKRSGNDNGPVTYRHLLSPQAMTVFNPLRTIAHCDIDAAYAQFEQVRLGLPDDIPLICAQWQSIIAVNYPARKYGIKRFTTLDEARKMCPELVVQHVATYRNGEAEAGYWGEVDPQTHKVSLDPYRRESLKILAIFKEMVPKGEIEKASIDEAFLDLTPMVLEQLLTIHPYLSTIPDDAPEGIDSPLPPAPPINWSKAGNVFPINGESELQDSSQGDEGDMEEQRSDDGNDEENLIRRNSHRDTWEDWALCIGAEIMKNTRDEVFRQLHYTCSAGIAHNKAMAKLCSAWKKPNNQTVLRAGATAAFLRDRDFTDIRTLGGKLGNAIATEYGAKTVGDMLLVPLEEMQSRFGEESIWVYNLLRASLAHPAARPAGIDHTEVKGRVATKSMLASKNVRPNVRTPEQGHHWLSVLSGELNVRLREAREVAPGLWPKTLVLSTRQGIDPSRSRQTPFPFTRNLSTDYILKYARKLWEEATLPMKNGNMKLNNIALSFTGLEKLEGGQQGIEGFFGQPKPQESQQARPALSANNSSSSATIPTLSNLNLAKRPLSPTPTPAPTLTPSSSSAGPSPKKPRLPTLHTGKKKMGLDAFLTKKGEMAHAKREESPSLTMASTSVQIQEGDDDLPVITSDEKAEAGPSKLPKSTIDDEIDGPWKCPECNETISTSDEIEQETRVVLLKAMKQEHEDWHFALSLQDGDGPHSVSSTSTSSNRTNGGTASGKKKKKKPEGIKAFFKPK